MTTTSTQRNNGDGRAGSAPPNRTDAWVAVLEHVAAALGLPFDHTGAKRALDQAEQDAPGEAQSRWIAWMTQAAKHLGVRVAHVRCPAREAVAMAKLGAPVLALAADDRLARRWVVLLDRRGRKARSVDLETRQESWIGQAEAARQAGLPGPDAPGDWLIAHPLAPCDSARDPWAGRHESAHSGKPGGAAHAGPMGHSSLPPLTRLWGLMRAERRDVWAVVAFSVAVGVLSLATPIAVQSMVTSVAFGGLLQPVIVLAILLMLGLGFGAVLRGMQTYVVEIIQRRIFLRMVADLAYRLPRVRQEAFDRDHGPELVNRFFDVLTVQKVVAMLLLDGLAILLQAVLGLLILAFYHPILLAFDIVLLGAIAFVVFGLGRRSVSTAIDESMAKYAVAGWLEEMARHPTAFKSRGGARFALEQADSLARQYLTARRGHFRIVFRQVIGSLSLQVLASTALLAIGGFLVIQKQLTLGQLVAAELIVTLVVASFAKLGKHLEGFYDLMAAVDKLGHLIDLPLERADGVHRIAPADASPRGASLKLTGVTFAYDEQRPVLRNLNIEITPGQRVAVVGPSGSGKTTLIDVLFSMRLPDTGRVELDGLDYRQIDLETLREHVSAVTGYELFDGTIYENVRMGRPDVGPAEVRDALDRVGLLDAVLALPSGVNTRLTTGGPPLSEGEARRLMIARALAEKPRLLIVDESLDGLDERSKPRVLSTLFDRQASWTLIVVTHNPEIARMCDVCYRMPDGARVPPPAVEQRVGRTDADREGQS